MRFFFRSKKFKIMLSVITIIVAVSVIVGIIGSVAAPGSSIIGAVVAPFQKGAAAVTNFFSDFSKKMSDGEKLIEENEKLREENSSLEKDLVDYYTIKEENEFYKNFLEMKKDNPDYKFEAAKLIAKDTTDTYAGFTIDKGSLSGIKVNDPVITAEGLVGYVSVVAPTYSNVKTILNPSVSVGAMDIRTSDAGVIKGDNKLSEKGKTALTTLPRTSSIAIGDYIVTSGGGVFPKGLVIGKIASVDVDKVNQSILAEITPEANLKDLRNVMIITHFEGQGVFAGDTDTGGAK